MILRMLRDKSGIVYRESVIAINLQENEFC